MALAYVAEQKGGILERIRKRKETEKQQTRTELQPLLSAAGLQASAGQSVAARASYKQILALDPDWPEALNAFGWFLYNQSVEMDRNSTLAAAFADAEEAHSFATRWHETGPVVAGARRLLTATNSQMGTVLLKRGQAGDADKALAHYTRSLELAEKLLTDYPAWALAKHDVSSSSEKLGDFLSKRGQPGDADAAFKHYTRENEIFWMLLVETPDSAEARRDAAMSLGKLGELLTERAQPGDKDKAFDYLTRFVEQCEKLLADNPDSAKARRDAYISLQKLGDFLAERAQPGDKDKALDDFTRSLELAEKLLAETPDSTEAKLDVASCQDRLGLFLAERGQPGDADAALKHYTRENEMTEKLLAENPGSAEAKHAVAVSVQRFGDLLVKRGRPGDADKAIDNFTRSLALREKLLTDNPNSVQAVRDVCMGLDKLGELLTQRAQPGDADKALTQYTRSLELREKLLADNPGSTDTKRDVCMGLENLGEFLIKRGQPGDADKAHAYYDRSLEIEAKLLTENPGSAWAVEDVVGSHSKLAGFAAKLGDKKGEALHRHIIFDLLKPYVERGGTFDPATMKLYGEVKAEFAK
jgi:tetratricopeptide (TPR) repeat protein